MGQGFRSSLSGWIWLKDSHLVTVIRKLDESEILIPRWIIHMVLRIRPCWLLAGVLCSSSCRPLHKLLKYLSITTLKFIQEQVIWEWKWRKLLCLSWYSFHTWSSFSHHDSYHMLSIRRKLLNPAHNWRRRQYGSTFWKSINKELWIYFKTTTKLFKCFPHYLIWFDRIFSFSQSSYW